MDLPRNLRMRRGGIVALDPVPIAAIHDTAPPWLVLQVPLECGVQALLERHRRSVAQFALYLGTVDRIAPIVPRSIPDEANERVCTRAARAGGEREDLARLPVFRKPLIGDLAQRRHDVDVLA